MPNVPGNMHYGGGPFPHFTFGSQFGANPAGTNSQVANPDQQMAQLMAMLRRFNPRQAASLSAIPAIPAAGTPGME